MDKNLDSILGLLIIVAIIGSICAGGYALLFNLQDFTVDVVATNKFIDVGKEGSHYITVTDKGLFEIDRPWWKYWMQEYNPDLNYAKITVGGSYVFHYYGWQIDWLYWYRTVFYVELIK